MVATLALALGASCAREGGPAGATGSSTIAISPDGQTVYVASSEAGALVAYRSGGGVPEALPVGRRPMRVARAGDHLFVSLHGDAGVAVLAVSPGEAPVLERTLDVGPEPVGIVASPDELRLYVAVAGLDVVLELDAETGEVLRRFEAPGRPSWLAIHPSGRALYVAPELGESLLYLDLDGGARREVALPRVEVARQVQSASGFTLELGERRLELTGDPAVTPGGETLLLPALYVDADVPLIDTGTTSSGVVLWSGIALPSLLMVPLDPSGAPIEARAAALASPSMTWAGPPELGLRSITGRLVAVAVAPAGDHAVLAFEGGQGVVATPLSMIGSSGTALTSGGGSASTGSSGAFSSGGTLSIPGRRPGLSTTLQPSPYLALAVSADAGPRGLAFGARGALWIESRIDGALSRVNGDQLRRALAGDPRASFDLRASNPVTIEPLPSAQVLRGRELFYGGPSGLSLTGAWSCATCHPDGQSDRREWSFASRPGASARTPTLAGARIEEDALRRWTAITYGSTASEEDLRALGAFLGQ